MNCRFLGQTLLMGLVCIIALVIAGILSGVQTLGGSVAVAPVSIGSTGSFPSSLWEALPGANPLPAVGMSTRVPLCGAEASSEEKKDGEDLGAYRAIDGDMNTRWSSDFHDPQWISVTLCSETTINRVVLHWESAYGRRYQIHVSQDGNTWYKVFSTDDDDGSEDVITFDPVTARYVRMVGYIRGTGWGYSLWEIEVFETDAPPVALVSYPVIWKGYYPRWFYRELNYWTAVGSPGSYAESLFSEDGVIGNPRNGFSLMPYLGRAGRLVSALDAVTVTQSLEEGYLPFPEVTWSFGGVTFNQRIFPYQTQEGGSCNYIWYTLENNGTTPVSGSLYLTVRPFHVRPPWMFGGMQRIGSVEIISDGLKVKINAGGGFFAISAPDNVGAIAYEDGGIMDDVLDFVGMGILPPARTVTSTGGYASAVLEYRYALSPGEKKDFVFAIPMDETIDESKALLTPADVAQALIESRMMWQGILGRVSIALPNQDIVHTTYSNLAYVIINQDGPALQPGSDNYDRAWMRDGAEIGVALLRTGHYTAVKEYLGWVASFQREDGLVHPVIDPDGWIPDVSEWDSQGQFIFLVSEYYKFTKDRAFLEHIFPNVLSATIFLENLRAQTITYPVASRFYGILPPSISHEGYPWPGKHSYWDDFWALKGWQEASTLAMELGRHDLLARMDNEYQELSRCLANSIRKTMEEFCIEYIPGSADDGDFDAVSTATAVWLTEQTDFLQRESLLSAFEYTLDKYYSESFLPRLRRGLQYGYTPYELRVAGAYLLLGQKDKTLQMLNDFLQDRRPPTWNQWGEVVHPGYRFPGYIGDMPHSWIGATYINLVTALFAHAKGDQVILGSGVDHRWLENGRGIGVMGLRTQFGSIGYTLVSCGDLLTVTFGVTSAHPERGLVFKSPFSDRAIAAVEIDGQEWREFGSREVYLAATPGKMIITFVPDRVHLPIVMWEDRSRVALLTDHGRYVTALHSCPFLKQEAALRDCGWFEVIRLAGGKIALMTCRDLYVTAPSMGSTDEEWALRQEPELSDCGQFTLHHLGYGTFALETCAHRYVTALDGNRAVRQQWLMIAGAWEVWSWERFTFIGYSPR